MWEEIKRKIRKNRRRKNSQLFIQEAQSPGFFSMISGKIPKIPEISFPKFLGSAKKTKIQQDTQKKKRNWFKILFWVFFDIGLLIGIIVLGWVFYITWNTPDLSEITHGSFAQSSVIYDSEGKQTLYTLYGEENRKVVHLAQISKNMQNAMLAAEDADFYNHAGLDWMGIARSVIYGIQQRRAVGGGSTLTQQLIKNVIFAKNNETMEEKITRKIQELTLSRQLENKYSKDRILELYLNKVPFGRNTYGVERAANIYFGKKASELTIAESAVLASFPQSPGFYPRHLTVELDISAEEIQERNITSLVGLKSQPDYKKFYTKGIFGRDIEMANGKTIHIDGRFDYVLGQLLEKGFISQSEFEEANKEAEMLEIKKFRTDIKAPHFVHFVEDELKKILEEEYGENFLQVGGLKIYTTLDYDLQKESEEILQELGEYNEKVYQIRNGAVLVMDPQTGEIKVMLGSRDYFADEINDHPFDGKVNVLTSKRQPGSTFKPISYAAAFEYKGLSPATVLMDVKTNFGAGYTPRNFDGKFHGPLSVRKSLGNSFNIPAVKAGIIAGLPKVFNLAQLMGISFDRDINFYGSAISLGSAEIRPLEMGLAYSTFANGGYRVKPVVIQKIVDKNGEILYEFSPELEEKEPVLQPETAFLITDILSDSKARGAGWSSILSVPGHIVAAKTGTSTAKGKNGKIFPHDAWTIGYTPQYLSVVWTGNNKGWKENPTGVLSNKASGLSNAGKIWQRVMVAAHKGVSAEIFSVPSGVRKVKVSKVSGKTPVEDFPEDLIVSDYFSTSFLPDSDDQTLKIIKLVENSKLLPSEFTPQKAIKEYAHLELHSYYPNKPSWENPVKEWLESDDGKTWIEELGIPDLIIDVPTVEDTEYTQEQNPPEVRILSPATMGTVTPPNITVVADPTAERTISRMDFYWDDELVATRKNAPWRVDLPISGQEGSRHLLRVEVIDRLAYMGEHTIEVAIGRDEKAPEVSIVYPSEGASLTAGELHQIKANASDTGSSIASVVFMLDGQEINKRLNAPFAFSWNADITAGRHTLIATATDGSGNTKSDTVRFVVSPSLVSPEEGITGDFKILSPVSGQKITGNAQVSFFISEENRVAEATIKVIARKKGSKKSIIYEITGNHIPSSGKVSFSWNPIGGAGEYSLSLGIWQGVYQEYAKKVTVEVE